MMIRDLLGLGDDPYRAIAEIELSDHTGEPALGADGYGLWLADRFGIYRRRELAALARVQELRRRRPGWGRRRIR